MGEVCKTRLYAGLSSTCTARIRMLRNMRARFSYKCDGEFSNADSYRLGRIQVSKGKRGAYGQSVTKSWFSAATRMRASISWPMMSQKIQIGRASCRERV